MTGFLGFPSDVKSLLSSKINVLLTDGASRGNPGVSGWAYVLLSGEKDIAIEASGHSPKDTNNRMELKAALEGLLECQKLGMNKAPLVVTDSKFVVDAMKSWRWGWKKNSWKKSDGNDVLHQDIFLPLDEIANKIKPEFIHIDAHKGHPGNTRCDLLAVAAAEKDQSAGSLFNGKLSDYTRFQKIYLDNVYSQPRYLCWNKSTHKEFTDWPSAQNFMKSNPGYVVKKIFSAEEITLITQKKA